MTSPRLTVLAAHLERLDRSRRRLLVADLWRARGFAVETDGSPIEARQGERTERIAVSPGSPPPTDVDVVVDGPGPEGAQQLGPRDLAEMLLYGVETEQTRRLCETHVGAAPESLRPPLGLRLRRRGRDLHRTISDTVRDARQWLAVHGGAVTAGLSIAIVLLVAAGIAVGPGPAAEPANPGSAGAQTTDLTEPPADLESIDIPAPSYPGSASYVVGSESADDSGDVDVTIGDGVREGHAAP